MTSSPSYAATLTDAAARRFAELAIASRGPNAGPLARWVLAALKRLERQRAALDYIERKIDGYESTFDLAREIVDGTVTLDGRFRKETP